MSNTDKLIQLLNAGFKIQIQLKNNWVEYNTTNVLLAIKEHGQNIIWRINPDVL
jgi:hypothetical protein